MTRPTLEVADIFHRYGAAYREAHRLPLGQLCVMRAIEVCRTAALGGHEEKCGQCEFTRHAYNSCRNRHCPKCQGSDRARWLESRKAELLPVEYFHVVFTVPEPIAQIAFYNKETVYNILFRATARTLLTIAGDPKHLGACLGFFAVLLTRGNAVPVYLSWIRPTSLLRLWSMGSESASPSPSALRRPRRRPFAGSRAMGGCLPGFFLP